VNTFTSTAKAYVNFALGLRAFLRVKFTPDDIKNTIRHELAHREENFLSTIRSNIFNHPTSPYLPLLDRAKITYEDIEKLVATHGLEGALSELYDAGVYVTFEELKGRIPIKRGELEYHVDNSDFDSPNLTESFITQSSGSTGKPSRTKLDLDYMIHNNRHHSLIYHLHGVFNAPLAAWAGFLPILIITNLVLNGTLRGANTHKWFSPTRFATLSPTWYYTLLSYLLAGMVRLHGKPYPFPEVVTMDDPSPIARWIVKTVQEHGSCLLVMTVSKALRLSIVAQEQGLDLTGAVFTVGGEPSTDIKIKTIEASGAKHVSQYSFTEAGAVGLPCLHKNAVDDMHFMSNHLALIQRPVTIHDQTVDAICITTLMPLSPKMLLNAQTDDFGTVETRDCGCPLHDLGLDRHIHTVRSYRKLTGEGVTLVGTDMQTILEEVFPQKFGGSSLDYQLVEEEDERGFTKLTLYVSPDVSIDNEQALIDTLLDAMKESAPSVQLAQPDYQTGQTIGIRRQKPILTISGKFAPIYTMGMKDKVRD
jgi:phenylacetate-coenzyme A ligase PaaK-like adenylate-forming protein